MRAFLRIACLLQLTFITKAQSDNSPSQIRDRAALMTKSSLEFLVQDNRKHKHVKEKTCIRCQTFIDLLEYSKRNKIAGGTELIDNIVKLVDYDIAHNPTSAIQNVKDKLLVKLTSGENSYRLQMKEYAGYRTTLDSLSKAKYDKEETDVDVPPGEKDPLTILSASQILTTWIPIGLSIINLILLFLLWKRKERLSEVRPIQSPEAGAQNERVSKLKELDVATDFTTPDILERVESLEGKFASLNTFFQKEKSKENASFEDDSSQQNVPLVTEVLSTTSLATRPQEEAQESGYPIRMYARVVDKPNGFSVSSLTDNPTRPMVFTIFLTGQNKATFRVSEEPVAQEVALSDPYSYLNEACTYTSTPKSNSQIETINEGRLSLNGDKWQIDRKAEINFR